MAEQATLLALRNNNTKNAIVFVHGFGGNPSETWGSFPDFLMESPALDGWDVYSLGYSSKLAPDFKGVWEGNPSITTIATYLNTRASVGKLEPYSALVFIAHSMGGLVVQRALLDHKKLLVRTSHVFLFGTPSAGLRKAGWFKWFGRQVDDLADDGAFIPKLRSDWNKSWPKNPPPRFWTVAGDNDEFVPASSSLKPFLLEQQRVVTGNHLEIVKPENANHLSVRTVVRGIQGKEDPEGLWNTARVALQMLDFKKTIDTLEPHANELDDDHLVELALALDGLGQLNRALEILEKAGRKDTDARGVLAGRIKRRWIAERRKVDYQRALELYSESYDVAATNEDHSQALYHGINVCFLMVAGDGKKADIFEMADKVLGHCDQATQDVWTLGTRGEAKLCKGDIEGALAAYRDSANTRPEPEPWQIKSMHSQACQLAAILGREDLTSELNQIFRQD